MSVLETILIFAVIPLAIYGLCAVATMRSKFAATPRYRPGQPWEHPPMWWSANPEGAGTSGLAVPASASADRGGARGNW